MKLQIDSTNKKITIQDPVNLSEFFEMVKGLFPNDMWKEFTLETNVINNWTNPIIIKEYPVYPSNPLYPINPPLYPQIPINPYPQNPSAPPFVPWVTYGSYGSTEGTYGSEGSNSYSLNKGIFNVEVQANAR